MTSSRRGFVVGLAIAAALLVVHAIALGYESDDAYISYRYARNLLDGHGLVYNPGERVEGYTNFLWTVLLAGIDGVVPGERLPAIGTALGLLFGGATVVLVGLFGRAVAGTDTPRVLIAPFLLAADSSFADDGHGSPQGTQSLRSRSGRDCDEASRGASRPSHDVHRAEGRWGSSRTIFSDDPTRIYRDPAGGVAWG